jgi:hypothetical protein
MLGDVDAVDLDRWDVETRKIACHPLLQALSRQRYMIEGAAENAAVVQALIDNLIERRA